MNFLDFQAIGGMPLFKDDFRFLQESLRDGITGALSFLPNNKVVVMHGLTDPSISEQPEGYIYFAGEVYHVANAAIPVDQQLIWDFTPEIDIDGNRMLLDVELMPHVIRKARIVGLDVDAVDIPPEAVKFGVDGEISTDTVGFYDVLASRLDCQPAGSTMFWTRPPNTIPEGWEPMVGQMGFFGGPFPSQCADMRRALPLGYDNPAAPQPFHQVGAVLNNIDFNYDTTPLRAVTGIWIIKNGSNIPVIFTY